MVIIKGSFGTNGKAELNNDKLVIGKYSYQSSDVVSVNADVIKENKFGIFGFVFGAAILGIIGLFVLSIIGAAIGVVAAYFGSRYSTSQHVVDISFNDNKTATFSGKKREIEKLVGFVNG